jgi:hypothetical protein
VQTLAGDRCSSRSLRRAGYAFALGFVAHNADHARRGVDAVTDHVVWGGTTVAVVAAVTLTLVFTGHRLAPIAAAAGGFGIAAGVSASHLAPRWSAFSDALPGGDVDGLTWVAVVSEIAAAAVLGLAGVGAMHAADRDSPGVTPRIAAPGPSGADTPASPS